MLAYRDTAARFFFPASLIVGLLLILAVYFILGPISAVKGGYVLVGLGIASAIHYLNDNPSFANFNDQHEIQAKSGYWNDYGKIVFILLALAILGADLLGSRAFLILTVLPACYLMLGIQLWQRAAVSWLLLQSIGLFLTSSVTQYLTTGFFFSRGDTLSHVRWTELVVAAGTPEAIPSESIYDFFPGLHTFLASTSVLTGLPPYDVYMLAGIVTFGVVILMVYCLGRYLFEPRSGLYIAVAMTLLTPVLIHSSYFFPQSLFFALVYILLFITYRNKYLWKSSNAKFSIISSLLISVLVFTHHLSVLLLIPVIAALVTVPWVINRLGNSSLSEAVSPRALPFVALVLASFAYWTLRTEFFTIFLNAVQDILRETLVASDTAGPRPYVILGDTLPEFTVQTSFLSLFSPGGIYHAVLIAIIALGVVTILHRFEHYHHALGVLFLGTIGPLIVLRTPLAIRGINRMRLPLSIFVAIVVGIGLYRLFSFETSSSLQISSVLIIFVLLATSAHATAGIDVYGIHSGPDLWERQSMPDTQTEFTDREHNAISTVTQFTENQDASVTTDWVTRTGIDRRFGGEASGNLRVSDGSLEIDRGFLLYRTRWSSHSQTVFLEEGTYSFAVTEMWLTQLDRNEHKIYTTGETTLVWDHDRSDYLQEDES